jgi:hypothetical protein
MIIALWIGTACALVALVMNVIAYVRYRRHDSPLPTYAVGAVSGNAATVCLLSWMMVGPEGPLSMLLVIATVVLLIVSISLSLVAWRRRRQVRRP